MAEQSGGDNVLYELLHSACDSAAGYEQGGSLARNPTFQSLFRDRAAEREKLIEQIEAALRSAGHEPVREGTVVGDVHRAFTYLRDAVARGSDKAVIEELVRREHLVMQRFQAASEDAGAPESARKLAGDALPTLTSEREELERLGEQFR